VHEIAVEISEAHIFFTGVVGDHDRAVDAFEWLPSTDFIGAVHRQLIILPAYELVADLIVALNIG
jgi:hypothetical protein